jgi:hypothetical protein
MEMRAEAGEYAACAGVKAREARRGAEWDGMAQGIMHGRLGASVILS